MNPSDRGQDTTWPPRDDLVKEMLSRYSGCDFGRTHGIGGYSMDVIQCSCFFTAIFREVADRLASIRERNPEYTVDDVVTAWNRGMSVDTTAPENSRVAFFTDVKKRFDTVRQL